MNEVTTIKEGAYLVDAIMGAPKPRQSTGRMGGGSQWISSPEKEGAGAVSASPRGRCQSRQETKYTDLERYLNTEWSDSKHHKVYSKKERHKTRPRRQERTKGGKQEK